MRPILVIATWAVCILTTWCWRMEDDNFWWREGCVYNSTILRTLPNEVSADNCRASCNAEYFCSHYNWRDGKCELLCGPVPTSFIQHPDKSYAHICANIKRYKVTTCDSSGDPDAASSHGVTPARAAVSWKMEDDNFWWREGCVYDSKVLNTLPNKVSADSCRAYCDTEYFCSHYNWRYGKCELLCGPVPTTFIQHPDKSYAHICANIKMYRTTTCHFDDAYPATSSNQQCP